MFLNVIVMDAFWMLGKSSLMYSLGSDVSALCDVKGKPHELKRVLAVVFNDYSVRQTPGTCVSLMFSHGDQIKLLHAPTTPANYVQVGT